MAAVALLAVSGCDRNIEAYREGEVPRQPDLARIFPAPTEPVEMGDRGGSGPMAAVAPTRGNTAPVDGSGTISGRVHLGEGVEATPGAVLFVIARPYGAAGGPPLAVLRISGPSFPFDFEIGAADMMIQTMRFEGPLGLTARLDADGNAMTRDPADPSATMPAPVTPGTTGVELTLE
jgi:hypothetical protein